MAEYEVPYLSAECPVCEYFGPHFRMPGQKSFTCELCNTSFDTGNAADVHFMLVSPDGDD
jgi:hypothetical protein